MRSRRTGSGSTRQREADGMGVAAEAGEEFVPACDVDGGERVEQVKAGDGAAGAVGLLRLRSQDERGQAGAVDDARGEDAEHAAMPLRVVEDDALRRIGAGGRAHDRELQLDGVERGGFGGAAVGFRRVELLRQFACAARDRG